ncbi:MAG: hypothetical protein J6Y02_06645 [Pseudobutyrivibrio sp.]|nr:hypothetical protein [Pseudobutyrivibrio sp.]
MPERLPKLHTNQNWKNKPSLDTPINQTNLNKLDLSVDNIDNRVCDFSETKADQTDLLLAVKNITFNKNTGVFTVTKFNNVSYNLDTDIEKIAVNFDYDENPLSPHYQCLVLTLSDGTVKYIDMSALITQYEFTDSAQIHFSVDASGKISAAIILGSITEDMLQPNFLADCRTEVSKAEGHANQANAWADGKINGTDIPSTNPAYNNYSKYWAEQAGTSASAAATSEENALAAAEEIEAMLKLVEFSINYITGNIEYNIPESVDPNSIAGRVMPIPKGLWNSETTYTVLDIVRKSDGSSWIAKRTNTNVNPVEGDDWQLLFTSTSGLVLTQTLLAGNTTLTFTHPDINDNSMIAVSTDVYGVSPTKMVQSGTSVTLTFNIQTSDVVVKLSIKEG